MKASRLAGLGLIVSMAGACGSGESAGAAGPCVCRATSVINAGHRGTGTNSAGNPFPENTIESIAQAFVEGAQMCELDVMHSADGVLVVMHDDTVDRTTDGVGCVGDLTVAELQALDAGFGTSLESTGVTVPTLAELLAAVDGGLNVEIKLRENASCPESDRTRLAVDVVAAVQGDGKPRAILVSSFDPDVLAEVEARAPSIEAGLLTGDVDDLAVATSLGLDALNLSAFAANAANIAAIHAAGLQANVWTVDSDSMMRELIDAGADMIITNSPDALAAVKAELCAEECP